MSKAQSLAMVPSEHEEQAAVVQWAERALGAWPELECLYAVPNGGQRDVRVARRLKAEGVRAGVPDLCLPVARGGWNALYVEMKRAAGGRVGPAQEVWAERLGRHGNLVVVCRGADEAIRAIEEYLNACPP